MISLSADNQSESLGSLPKIGNTVCYVALWEDEWLALLSFSAAALKCGARDRWIGWDYRHQFDRLNLIANYSRFLILSPLEKLTNCPAPGSSGRH